MLKHQNQTSKTFTAIHPNLQGQKLFRFFIDGSIRIYFLGTAIEGTRSFPIELAQVGCFFKNCLILPHLRDFWAITDLRIDNLDLGPEVSVEGDIKKDTRLAQRKQKLAKGRSYLT